MVKDIEIIVIEPADKDFLTGIPSRLCVERKLKQDLEKDASGTYSIILFDIDYFKHINDELGHNQGDKVLQEVGKFLETTDEQMRKYAGLYGRWGGEEFLMALPYATDQDALELAESIREAIAERDFHDVNTGRTLEEKITISLGTHTQDLAELSEEPGASAKVKRIVEKADLALAYSKILGRNRVSQFSKHIEQELRNLNLVRRFYNNLKSEDAMRLEQAVAKSRNMKGKDMAVTAIFDYVNTILKYIPPKDTRTKAVFANGLYREIRKLPCKEKIKVLNFIKYFEEGRYN